MQESVIDVRSLTKEYLDLTALRSVSFRIDRGESVGLIGSNGAGKSTLLHILMGFLPFDGGDASVLGAPVRKMNAGTKARIGFIPEESGLVPWATFREIAALYRNLYVRWDEQILERLVDDWEIPEDQRMVTLSKGERRLAEIALALGARPDLLLLDEPFNGLDAVMRIRVLESLREANGSSGTTVFYSSHILSDIEKVARRVVIIRRGEIALDSPIGELERPVEETFVELYGLDEEPPPEEE